MKKPFNFMVDTIQPNSLSVAKVKQFDTALFNITITENGSALDLSNTSLRFFVRKADGKLVFQDEGITIVDAKAGKISIDVRNSAFQFVGVAVAEIDIKSNDQPIATADFYFDVDEKLGNDEAVKSVIDVDLFTQLSNYIEEALADIKKYKGLMEAFTNAGVSIEGLHDIKAYIDTHLDGLTAENKKAAELIPQVNKARTDAEAKRVEVVNTTATAEAKRVDVVNATNTAEAKRVEVVNATNTADASKKALDTSTATADAKKKEVDSSTASAEAKRVELNGTIGTANNSKSALEGATATANASRSAIEGSTATANESKKALDGSIASGNASKSALDTSKNNADASKKALDGSIGAGNTLKGELDSRITTGNATKGALDTATASANSKKDEVITATNNAESKRVQVVDVTGKAESKRAELQKVIDDFHSAGLVRSYVRTGSQDFNLITDSGVYFLVGENHLNKPPTLTSGKGGSLFVEQWKGGAGNNTTVIQRFIDEVTGQISTRVKIYAPDTWTAWNTVFSTANKPKWEDIQNKPSDYPYIAWGNNKVDCRQLNDWAGLEKKNNVDIQTCYGLSVSNKCAGQPVEVDGVAFSVNARNGYVWAKGEIYAQSSQRVYHTGFKPSASDVGALPITGGTINGNLTVGTIGLGGKDLVINGKRALVGYGATDGNELHINYDNDYGAGVNIHGLTRFLNSYIQVGGDDRNLALGLGNSDMYLYNSKAKTYLQLKDNGGLTFNGSRILTDIQGSPLWQGYHHMSEKETVTPSKPLSQCNNGWVIVWSDWDDGSQGQNWNICYTHIPKNTIFKAGQNHTFPLTAGESSWAIKTLYIYDNYFKGCDTNKNGDNYDVVIRAVLEY